MYVYICIYVYIYNIYTPERNVAHSRQIPDLDKNVLIWGDGIEAEVRALLRGSHVLLLLLHCYLQHPIRSMRTSSI